MKWLRKLIVETHWNEVSLEIDIFMTFLEVFKKTAPGVRYYVNCTEEQDADTHKTIAACILKTLRYIKKFDIGAYKTIVHLYKDDIRDVITVYRQ